MGPEMMLLTTALSAGSTLVGGVAQANFAKKKAEIESQWAERRANDERGAAQRNAGSELRKARLAQSRLRAVAGGSGSGADDPTVMNLWGDIEKEGRYNAAARTAAGEQKAAGIDYQSALNSWSAAANAKSGLIGTILSAGGQAGTGWGKMMARYPEYGSTSSTGYGSGWKTTVYR